MTDTQKTPLEFKDSHSLAQAIMELLDEKKAENCQLIDVRAKATFCDFFIVASGNVGRQLNATAEHVARFLKSSKFPHAVEGSAIDDWILVDGGDVVVHLFRPEARERYALEKMWSSEA